MKASVLCLVLLLVVAVSATKTVKEVVAALEERVGQESVQLQSQVYLGLQKAFQNIREDLEAAKTNWVILHPERLLESEKEAVDDIKGTAGALKY